MNFDINQDWTLFLDRDGVINQNIDHGYVLNVDQFKFCEGTLEALKILRKKFGLMLVVTNQRGVGKGIMTREDLNHIHVHMLEESSKVGGKIDEVFYCTDVNDDSPDRKPQIGMALKAKKEFPDIEFSESIMVGNKLSDMEFGRNAGMKTVFIASTNPEIPLPHPAIDARFDNLLDFAKSLK